MKKPIINITIDGKDYPCRMTLGAMVRFERLTGKDVSKMDTSSISEMATLLYCGVKSACNVDGMEFGLSLDDFCDNLSTDEIAKWAETMKPASVNEEKKSL